MTETDALLFQQCTTLLLRGAVVWCFYGRQQPPQKTRNTKMTNENVMTDDRDNLTRGPVSEDECLDIALELRGRVAESGNPYLMNLFQQLNNWQIIRLQELLRG